MLSCRSYGGAGPEAVRIDNFYNGQLEDIGLPSSGLEGEIVESNPLG